MGETTPPPFTPGPWIRDGEYLIASDPDVMVAHLPLEDGVDPTEWQANLHLISAAPNLYAALLAYVEHFGDPLKLARAALAKADGR